MSHDQHSASLLRRSQAGSSRIKHVRPCLVVAKSKASLVFPLCLSFTFLYGTKTHQNERSVRLFVGSDILTLDKRRTFFFGETKH